MNFWLNQTINSIIIILIGIIIHEFGHYTKAKELGWNIKFGVEKGLKSVFFKLDSVKSVRDQILILERGIYWGLSIVVVLGLVYAIYFLPVILFGYYMGCNHDIELLKKLKKRLKER